MKFQLLNVDTNAKTVKGQSKGYMTAVLYLLPAALSGVNLCPLAEMAGCHVGCLNTAGRGGIAKDRATFTAPNGEEIPDNAVQRARLRRTMMFINDRDAFMTQLRREILAARDMAERRGLTLVVRLNGTSDIRWEDVPLNRDLPHARIFDKFSGIQFYDYTKIPNRRRALKYRNYHLTFSYSHRPEFAPIVAQALQTYGDNVNFAGVFNGTIPTYFMGRWTINGDDHDLRFTDTPNRFVALKAKGRAKKDQSGFTIRLSAPYALTYLDV
jgi:hypothetical protein